MQTSPKERLPIRTIITPRDMQVIKDAIQRETDRGGQVFFVHNRVQTIDNIANELMREMPDNQLRRGTRTDARKGAGDGDESLCE